MNGKTIILWIMQLACAAILFMTAWGKLASNPHAVYMFQELGMEPTGRYIVGVVEFCAALFLLNPRLAATGGLLALGTMLGAIIAHVSVLGFHVRQDHGKHVILLCIVLISAVTVTIVRRRHLPIIGSTFEE